MSQGLLLLCPRNARHECIASTCSITDSNHQSCLEKYPSAGVHTHTHIYTAASREITLPPSHFSLSVTFYCIFSSSSRSVCLGRVVDGDWLDAPNRVPEAVRPRIYDKRTCCNNNKARRASTRPCLSRCSPDRDELHLRDAKCLSRPPCPRSWCRRLVSQGKRGDSGALRVQRETEEIPIF